MVEAIPTPNVGDYLNRPSDVKFTLRMPNALRLALFERSRTYGSSEAELAKLAIASWIQLSYDQDRLFAAHGFHQLVNAPISARPVPTLHPYPAPLPNDPPRPRAA